MLRSPRDNVMRRAEQYLSWASIATSTACKIKSREYNQECLLLSTYSATDVENTLQAHLLD